MIHVVSGFMRTGTSCLMQAIIAGGMTADFDRALDEEWNGDERYKPNAGGFYELQNSDMDIPGWPLHHEGRLLKVLSPNLSRMSVNPNGYRIVFMFRHPEEIRQSWQAFKVGRIRSLSKGFTDFFAELEQNQAKVFRAMMNRRDVESVVPLNYREVAADPLQAFETLAEAGWQIDVTKAVAVVDPAKCRYRIENLTVGL